MKFYENYLKKQGFDLEYIGFNENWIESLREKGFDEVVTYELNNFDLEEKLIKSGFNCVFRNSPMFLSTNEEFIKFFSSKTHFSQTSFYIYMRKKHNLLLDKDLKPIGGKWTYDKENRKKFLLLLKSPNV
jgi:deoxyribodipyrimidine photolyase-related protein